MYVCEDNNAIIKYDRKLKDEFIKLLTFNFEIGIIIDAYILN